MIYWLPISVCLVATLFFMGTDESPGAKIVVAGLFGFTTFLWFFVDITFAIPLVLQCMLAIGLLFYFQVGQRL